MALLLWMKKYKRYNRSYLFLNLLILNKNLSPLEQEDVIKHEKVHLNQMERGDLDYDNDNVYWKGKKIPRSTMDEGNKNLPWEREAYKVNKK